MTRVWALGMALAVAGAALAVGGWLALRPAMKPAATATGAAGGGPAPAPPEVRLPPGVSVCFRDVTRSAGIDFGHFDGRTEMQYIMDQTGSGLGWLDYDQDGLLDLFVVQGSTFLPPHPDRPPTCKLFKNLGGGRFHDVTAEVGLAHVGCGQGVAVGDVDNDGFPDLFVTCYGKPNVLYRNVPDDRGGRRFVDVTARAGLADHPDWKDRPNYSTSAAFLDYNNDGLLDLFVCSYVRIDLDHYPNCRDKKGKRDACAPTAFAPTRCVLYRNNGDGTFTDVSGEAGVDEPRAKALGVVALDLDDDGLIDIFVANDSVPNFFFHNLGGGRFESVGLLNGCGVNRAGNPQAYMGVDADDLNGDGLPDLFSTAFHRETNTFFKNHGRGLFTDMTVGSGLGPPSWNKLAWGCCFLDVDRDGNLDIAVTNGHVSANVDEDGNPENTFRQQPQLFLNLGKGRFQEVSEAAGAYFQERHVGRGLAACDYDNDGHVDLAFSNSGEPAVLLHNESTTPHHWLRLDLQGTKSNRDAVGARVAVLAGGRKLVRHRKGGGSYCSASDPRLFFGLAEAAGADLVEVRWPSGLVQRLGPLVGDRSYRVVEGEVEVRAVPSAPPAREAPGEAP
jgi:enediyne biosynthesis protein E4